MVVEAPRRHRNIGAGRTSARAVLRSVRGAAAAAGSVPPGVDASLTAGGVTGAKVIGGIHVGTEAAIGANAVVTKDVPERGVVGGIPAKLLSDQGSDGYINRLAPPELLAACEGALYGSRTKPG